MGGGFGADYGQVRRGHRLLLCVVLLVSLALPPMTASAETRPRPRPDSPLAAGQEQPQSKPRPRPAAAAPAAAPTPQVGPVTRQPLPRYVSLKGNEGNARRGPGLSHRIDWVFTTKGTPLKVTAEYENWRRVEDFEGFGGWVHYTLLSVARTVLVTTDMAQFHTAPNADSPLSFQAERGVLARLLECRVDWCRVSAEGQRGWAPKTALWGVDPWEKVE